MPVSHHLPWQVNVAAKVVLSRMPVSYRAWKRLGFFNEGAMDRPEYAFHVFRKHFEATGLAPRQGEFVCLELGPGDSLATILIASAFGASQTYLVDVTPHATTDLAPYCELAEYLSQKGFQFQVSDISNLRNVDELLTVCSGKYLIDGLNSLRQIPSATVDFAFGHASLQQVRRAEFLPVLKELRRIQKPQGAGSYSVSMRDLIGGAANDLRFSNHSWESPLLADAGFYTNRIRYSEMLGLFKQAGFETEVIHVGRWDKLPLERQKLASEFRHLSDEDIRTYEWDVVLH